MSAKINEGKFVAIQVEVAVEFREASANFDRFNSYHEGYAVIKEEMDELWDAVKLNHKRHPERDKLIRKEAIQVAGMALRFLHDVCEEGSNMEQQPLSPSEVAPFYCEKRNARI
jgi:hypothetical protein